MQLFFFSFGALLLAFLGMALGVILNNKVLKGSCGGLSNIPGMKSDCSCSSPCEKRKAKMKQEEAQQDNRQDSDQINHNEYAKINIDKLRINNK